MAQNTAGHCNLNDEMKKAWSILVTGLAKYSDKLSAESYSGMAALLYLLKEGALAYSLDSYQSDPDGFLRIDNISEETAVGLGLSGSDVCGNLHFYSTLAASDPMYNAVRDSLQRLSKGMPRSFTAFLMDVVSGDKDISESCGFFDEVIHGSGASAIFVNCPVELMDLIFRLVDFKGESVLNLFQNGFIAFAKTISGYGSFRGIGINHALCDFISLYLSLCEKYLPLECMLASDLAGSLEGRYDIIISNPQLYRINRDEDPIDLATLAMEKFEGIANEDGVLFAFVPTRVLFEEGGSKDLRKRLLRSNLLDSVIVLPYRLVNAQSGLALVVLRKGRAEGAKIRMVDASKMTVGSKPVIFDGLDVEAVADAYFNEGRFSVGVTAEEIEDNLCSINASLYVFIREQIKGRTFRQGFESKFLCDVLDSVHAETASGDEFEPAVCKEDIPTLWTDNMIDVGGLEKVKASRGYVKLTRPALLISSLSDKFGIAWCDATEERPVFVERFRAINVFSPKCEAVCIDYLAMEIAKKKENIPFSYNWFLYVTKDVLRRILIDFPVLDSPDSHARQVDLFNEGKSAYRMGKIEENGLRDEIYRMRDEYIKEVRMRRHDMKPHLRQIRSCNELLLQYSDELPTEVTGILNSQKLAIDAMSASLDRLTQESRFGTPEPIDLIEYFDHLRAEHAAGDIYGVEVFVDGVPMEVYREAGEDLPLKTKIALRDLDDMIQNVVINAVTHGFTDPDRQDYSMFINLGQDVEKDMVTIELRNNGNPFPKGMTKERYGLLSEKAGRTAGTGIGGYRVKSIVKHYGGDFEISDPGASPVFVRIYLPIYRG